MIRTLCLTLFLATASAATIAITTYSSPAPAATPTQPQGQPPQEQTPRNEGARPSRINDARSADACRLVVWPQIPAECMKNDNDGRARRAVRVIPIHNAGAN